MSPAGAGMEPATQVWALNQELNPGPFGVWAGALTTEPLGRITFLTTDLSQAL